MQTIKVKVNELEYQATVADHTSLLSFLRDYLGLTGTKEGCGTGDCGACTVLLEGQAVNSCLVLAVEADGKSVITIEGLARPGQLHPLQESFVQHGAIQCGFCTPGMIVNAYALLKENPAISEEEIRRGMAGNLCRCTGYQKIIQAILTARQYFS